jgi:hypothetical protein
VIEDDLDAIFFNYVALTIPKWRSLKLMRWKQNLHQSTWDHEVLYVDRSLKDEQLVFVKVENMNLESG